MMIQFLLGKKGLKIVDACDTRAVINRHQNGMDRNEDIIKELKKQIFSKKEKSRTLYYILLTDGYFPYTNTDNAADHKYFPGHVFILEKLYDFTKQQHVFYFYQSYINKYSLTEHIKMNKGLKISHKRTEELINDLSSVLRSPTWNNDNVKKWYDMTFVDSSDFLQTASHQKFYLCFRKAKTNKCLERLETFLKKKHKMLSSMPIENENNVYGEQSLYDISIKPLTNKEMIIEIESLLFKIYNEKSSYKY
jgi:hypothetical protein